MYDGIRFVFVFVVVVVFVFVFSFVLAFAFVFVFVFLFEAACLIRTFEKEMWQVITGWLKGLMSV